MDENDECWQTRSFQNGVGLEDDFLEAEKKTAIEILGEGKTRAKVLELAENAHRFAGHMISLVEDQMGDLLKPVACRAGCRFCCYHQIITSPPEALLIEDYLESNFSEHDWRGLTVRVRKNMQLIEGKDTSEIVNIRHLLPCIFLRGNRCSIYQVRPMGCRAWSSNNADQCKKGFESKDPLAGISNYLHRQRLSVAIHTALLEGTKQMGLESGYMDLTKAVNVLLDNELETLAQKWLDGEEVFSSVMDYSL